MNITRCFEILEISPDATYEEAKTAYRLMCQVWHPDKYNHSEQLHAKATTKIKEINAAWSQIEEYFKNAASRENEPKNTEPRASDVGDQAKSAEQERLRKDASRRVEREKASKSKIDKQLNDFNPTSIGNKLSLAVIFAIGIWIVAWIPLALLNVKFNIISEKIYSSDFFNIATGIIILAIGYSISNFVSNNLKND